LGDGAGIERGTVAGDERAAITVSARVRQLQADDEVIVAAPGVAMGLAALAEQTFEGGSGGVADEQLSRVGAALFEHSSGLAPDQLGPAVAETVIAAIGQFVRLTVE